MISTIIKNVFNNAVVLCMYFIIQDINCKSGLEFQDPIQIQKCGLQNHIDYWTTKVNVTHGNVTKFRVKLRDTLICREVKLNNCLSSSTQTEPHTERCYCVYGGGDSFLLVIQRLARAEERGEQLNLLSRAEERERPLTLFYHNDTEDNFYSDADSEPIGHIPAAIYKPALASYCVDDYVPTTKLALVQTVIVTSPMKIGILFCVENLLPGFVLSINGNASSPERGCLFQAMFPPADPVVFAYNETDGCHRHCTFYLNIRVRIPTTTPVTTSHSSQNEETISVGAIFFFILLSINVASALFVWCAYLQKHFDIFNRLT